MSDLPDDARNLIRAARRIRLAGSCTDVASALLRAAVAGSPEDAKEWRLRAAVRGALESSLLGFQLNLSQRAMESPERANDLRLLTRKTLERVLRAVSKLDNSDLFRFADMAVSTVAALAGSTDSLDVVTGERNPDRVAALLSLSGKLFIPAEAAEFAQKRGLSRTSLTALLTRAGDALRKAVGSRHASRVGDLRLRRDCTEYNLSLRAALDTGNGRPPVIRIELTRLDAPDSPPAHTTLETDDSRFTARLLRVLAA